jgi:hypothetical protein
MRNRYEPWIVGVLAVFVSPAELGCGVGCDAILLCSDHVSVTLVAPSAGLAGGSYSVDVIADGAVANHCTFEVDGANPTPTPLCDQPGFPADGPLRFQVYGTPAQIVVQVRHDAMLVLNQTAAPQYEQLQYGDGGPCDQTCDEATVYLDLQ